MNDEFRGTGTTTRQMKAAPHGAVYIWVHRASMAYAKDLAESIGRNDLLIVSKSWLEHGWQGRDFSAIVIDHATSLSIRENQLYRQAQARVHEKPT